MNLGYLVCDDEGFLNIFADNTYYETISLSSSGALFHDGALLCVLERGVEIDLPCQLHQFPVKQADRLISEPSRRLLIHSSPVRA